MKVKKSSKRKIQIENTHLFLIGLTVLIVICVLIFNVVYFSSYYGIAQIDYINSLFLVPLILFIFSFGIFIEQNKQKERPKKIDTFNLTSKEKEVTTMILEKKKNKEIANELYVELSTIKTHINNIYKKVEVKNRKELFEKMNG
ncbi:response regulator transcription factor [Maribacter ulvicola]|uniref:Regulatory protein, luxR family n=1 Tax=Maribacter ulvicola TaxID=228959 RepID=A0A1N6RVI0_9FLAO|nr:LuxR C-terminal-related transcriptional regulator [Maribacter ulvicola]SIQ32726.1 regulatory protein, luxR family [Maribacter ulvicola]